MSEPGDSSHRGAHIKFLEPVLMDEKKKRGRLVSIMSDGQCTHLFFIYPCSPLLCLLYFGRQNICLVYLRAPFVLLNSPKKSTKNSRDYSDII